MSSLIMSSLTEQMQNLHLTAKLEEQERQQHDGINNGNTNHKMPSTSPKYLEAPDQIKNEQDYHASIFNMSHSRYPYARELMETYHHKLSLNLQNAKKEEEEEELNVDTDSDVNMLGIYQNRETQNETSNVPEDLSKKGRKRNVSTEDSNRYHPYKHDRTIKGQSLNIISPPPEEQSTRQSPSPNVDMM